MGDSVVCGWGAGGGGHSFTILMRQQSFGAGRGGGMVQVAHEKGVCAIKAEREGGGVSALLVQGGVG